MTDLLTRPRRTNADDQPRSLPVAAVFGGVAAVVIGVVMCMAVTLIGWFLADAGAHGSTTDAIGIGADAWLLGHGVTVDASAGPIGVMPLGLTALLLLIGFRCGRWAGAGAQRIEDDNQLLTGVGVAAGVYVVAGVIIALIGTRGAASPNIPEAVLASLVVAVLGCGSGLAVGTGRARVWLARVPARVRSVGEGVMATLCTLTAATALLVALGIVLSFNETGRIFSGLGLSFGNAVMMLLVCVLAAPNALLLTLSWLAGPGFAVGTGTSVTLTSVQLGPLPAFPLLAAIPGPGAHSHWWLLLLAVPAICAAVGAGLAQRRFAELPWDSVAVRGLAVGVASGLVLWVLIRFAGGSMGTGRMADIGAPAGETLLALVGGLGIGGALGGLAVAWRQRR